MNSSLSNGKHCSLCHTITKYRREVQKIIESVKMNCSSHDKKQVSFKSTPICESPQGTKLTLDDIEKIYSDQYPEWHKKLQSFPEGPLFSDKLFNTQPYIRAKDIEIRRHALTRKIKTITTVSLSIEKHEELSREILESLKPVIEDLKLTNNRRITTGLSKVLDGKLKGKWKDLANRSLSDAMDIIVEIQQDLFDMILENDKLFKLYEMR